MALASLVREKEIRSIAVPPLGSGLGGLNWTDVRPRIEAALGTLADVEIFVYEPGGAPAHERMAHRSEVPEMTAGRAVLVELMRRYLAGLLDPFITLLEVHKLMYFMQEAGEPLKLRFTQALYGPHAENLRPVLDAIERHLTAGYADGGDAPAKQLSLVPGAIEAASAILKEHPDTFAHFDRVSALVEGFESSFGLELLATVHWVMKHSEATALDEVTEATWAWNERKRQFSPRQIGIAMDVLHQHNWVPAPAVSTGR